MKNFIQINNNEYTVKISLQNIQYSDIGGTIKRNNRIFLLALE